MKPFAFIAAAAALLSGAAAAQPGPGLTLDAFAEAMRAEGYAVEFAGEGAERAILSEADALPFAVAAYDCDAGGAVCRDFNFTAAFEAPEGFGLAEINAWNASEIAGRAVLAADGALVLDHTVAIGGAEAAAAIPDALSLWADVLADFADVLWPEAAPDA